MYFIKKWTSFNESKYTETIDILPEEAKIELNKYYIDSNTNRIEVYPDPKVEGTYAVRVFSKHLDFDLLWYKGGFDEVYFTNWPPSSEELRFF